MGRGHHDQTHGQWGVIPDLESNTGHGIATTSNGGQGGVGHGVATTSTRILAMIPPCPPPLTTCTHFSTLLCGSKVLTHMRVLCICIHLFTCFNLLACMSVPLPDEIPEEDASRKRISKKRPASTAPGIIQLPDDLTDDASSEHDEVILPDMVLVNCCAKR